jgi:threonine synthase
MWRYRELLPVRKVSDIVSLGEVTTPLIRLAEACKETRRRRDHRER